MHQGALESLTPSISSAQLRSITRRGITRLLGGLALGGPLALGTRSQVEAKCKKTCGPCKRCKKGKCKPKPAGTVCAGGTCQGGACLPASVSPPPPQSPLETGPGHCGFFGGERNFVGGRRRFAQTFLPPRGGQLVSAKIFLLLNPADFVLTFEIRTVDRSGIPTETILGTTTALMSPSTVFTNPPSPPRKLTATFSPPVPITLGQRYALTLTAPATQYLLHANTDGNACPDGSLFGDNSATGDFIVLPEVDADLVYAVTIL